MAIRSSFWFRHSGFEMPSGCPDSAILAELLASRLNDIDQAAAESHVESCAHCQERLQQLADVSAMLPKTSIPSELRDVTDSQRLAEVMRAMRLNPPSPRTAVGSPETDVEPLSKISDHAGAVRSKARTHRRL